MMKKYLLFCGWFALAPLVANSQVQVEPLHIVVLGSSTAEGVGPSNKNNAWVNRYRAFLQTLNPNHQVTNLAKGGYTTYHLMPTGFVPPSGKPLPDSQRNISRALALNPSAIIINLPSNDATSNYTVQEQLANYDSVLARARTQHVPVWISTTQPRNLSEAQRQNLMDVRDSTFARFGTKAIDFWNGIADSTGRILPQYNSGDGIHLNDEAHRILFERVKAADIQEIAASSDSAFLDLLQKTAFDFFWKEANASNGLIKDRSASGAACSIASVGFGLTAIGIAIDHNWITRTAGRDRVLATLKTFWEKPQGRDAQNMIGYKGFFYHFLDMNTAVRTWNSELSSIDTALLLAGIIYAKQYFTATDSLEGKIRALADSIYYRADWSWMRNFQPNIMAGWFPETGFIKWWWSGYNEAMIMTILGLGSPTHPIPPSAWQAWTSGYSWQSHYGYAYVNFPPLFGHQYSHCWIDFRGIQDAYMRDKGIDYFENSRRAALAARAYCIANPMGHKGYGENLWGITACDGPNGYAARGAPPAQNDDGTIAPTAAAGSMPFAPEESIAALRYMYDTYNAQIWMQYGFRDAFNLNQNWWGSDVIGIDEGPIIVMIENYRTGRVWELFMQNADVRRGLDRAGFSPLTDVEAKTGTIPNTFTLFQNYPNPFNPSTRIRFNLPYTKHVTLKVFDVRGNEVRTLVDGVLEPGEHVVELADRYLPSGIYFYSIRAGEFRQTRKAILVR